MNVESDNAFFNYVIEYPNFTINDLTSNGFVNESVIDGLVVDIIDESENYDDDEVYSIFQQIDISPVPSGICILCCTGCLNNIRRDHCWKSIVWEWGPGC